MPARVMTDAPTNIQSWPAPVPAIYAAQVAGQMAVTGPAMTCEDWNTGLKASIHDFPRPPKQVVDGRHEAGHECVREDALSARWKSVSGLVATQ